MGRQGEWNIPNDWQEEDGYLTVLFCIPNSRTWRTLIYGQLTELQYGRYWDETTGNVKAVVELATEIGNSITVDCNNDLARIADALESLDSKAALLYTWDELLEDAEAAFGAGSVVLNLLNGIIGLMPNLKAKVDMTWVAQALWSWHTFTLPLFKFLGAITAAQTVQAAAATTGRILGIIDTIMGAIAIMQTAGLGWYDIILGDKNIWDDLVMPLWSYFISNEDGGQGGDDPDADIANRILVRVYADVYVDELVPKLEEIRLMLETRMVAETVAGNTRADEIKAVLDAVENILGGTYEP